MFKSVEKVRGYCTVGLEKIALTSRAVELPHSIELRGEACHRSAKAPRGEDLQVEKPVACWDFASFHFHATLAGMLRATLIRSMHE
jgi:hypothetical protein